MTYWGAIMAASGVGAALRHLVDAWISTRSQRRFPIGTVVVNLTGSCIAGALAGTVLVTAAAEPLGAIVAGGLLGSYTTFSTALVQTFELAQTAGRFPAVVNLAATIGLTTVGALAGLLLVTTWV